jgi:CrcB protein
MTVDRPMTAKLDPLAVAAIAVGGGFGSVARYGIGRAWPPDPHRIPWSTLTINLAGSLLLGMLVVAITEIWRPHRLIRPLFGTGVLGGFTTFSTFAVETRTLASATATTYLALSVIGGLVAAMIGMALIRQLEPRLQIAPSHEVLDSVDPELP